MRYVAILELKIKELEDQCNRHTKDLKFLDALHDAGVHNWEGYDATREEFINQNSNRPNYQL